MAAMAIHQRNAIVRHRHCVAVAVGVDCGWRRIFYWVAEWMDERKWREARKRDKVGVGKYSSREVLV